MQHEPIKVCDADSPEWLDLRGQGLGASEAAAICGHDEYKQPLEVWYEKVIRNFHCNHGAGVSEIAGELEISENYVRQVLDPPDAGDDAWFGTHVEPVIAKFFERTTGRKVLESPVGMFRHGEHDWMRATPDAIVEPAGEGREGGEWKSLDPHYARILGISKDSQELPAEAKRYYLQAFWQMEVCSFDCVHFGILIGRRLVPFEVQRDERIIAFLRREGEEMWERIINRDPPAPDFSHRRALDLQKTLHDYIDGTRIQMTEQMEEVAARLRELKAEIKERETEKDRLNAQMMNFVGNHAAAVMSDGMEMRKIAVPEKEISYVRKASVHLRECKAKSDGLILPDGEDPKESIAERFDKVDLYLRAAHFRCYESHRGSRYYIAIDNSDRVRVSDHPPNKATKAWMRRQGVVDVRVNYDEYFEGLTQMIRQEDYDPNGIQIF